MSDLSFGPFWHGSYHAHDTCLDKREKLTDPKVIWIRAMFVLTLIITFYGTWVCYTNEFTNEFTSHYLSKRQYD
jgi:hypothetical protein